MNKKAEFVLKKRVVKDIKEIDIKETKTPWYLRPLSHEEFITKKNDEGRFYIRHTEWNKGVWIGPYASQKDADKIIQTYVDDSFKHPLDRNKNENIHSVVF